MVVAETVQVDQLGSLPGDDGDKACAGLQGFDAGFAGSSGVDVDCHDVISTTQVVNNTTTRVVLMSTTLVVYFL